MVANLQGLELTYSTSVYNFEPYKEDNKQRNITIESRDWELGDPINLWKVPLFPFDGGLRQDRLPTSADLTRDFNRARSYSKANIDASNAGVLVPPPFLNSTELTNSTTSTKQKSFDELQFHLCGRYIYTIARDGTLAIDKDFGSGKAAVDFEVFNNELIVAMGESEKIWKRDNAGTWTQASDATYAIALGVVGNKLWRAETTNRLSSCTTTPLTLANWTPASPNQYTVGDTSHAIHTIIEYAGVPWAIRADGVFAPDSKSDFYNQTPQIANWPHNDNGKGAFTAQGYLWVPTVVGLLRLTIGESLVFGPEKSNRPDFRFWVRGGVEWGEAIYLLVTDEIEVSESFICKMTRDEHGVTDNHVYVYHEWVRLGSADKGYSIGINTWPSSGPVTVTRDAGTIANVAGAGVDWSNPSNAVASDNTYATSTAGTTDPLRFSNFGFTLPTDATILGYIASLERKTSAASSSPSSTGADSVTDDSGVGSKTWTIDIDAGVFSFAQITSTTTVLSHYLKFADWDFVIPTNATITGVKVTIRHQMTSGVVADSIVRLLVGNVVVGTNKANSSGWGGTVASAVYGSSNDLWGLTLTPAQVNATDFGFVLAVNVGVGTGFVYGTAAGAGGVPTQVEVTYTVDGTVDSIVKLVNASGVTIGDNKASTSDWPAVDTVIQYGDDDDLWGTTLTPSDVNDTDFGFSIVVVNPATITASVDYGSMTVVYQPAVVNTNPVLFVGHGTSVKYVQMGFGSGRDIDDPNYSFGVSLELETGLIQPTQDLTLVSGLIGCSIVGKIKTSDSITLSYGLSEDTSYTNLLDDQESGAGTAAINGDGTYSQHTRLAAPNAAIGPYFKFKLSGTLLPGSGTNKTEIRNWWAYGYSRPKVTDFITIPIYASRMTLNNNGVPQGRTGGDVVKLFRAWKRDQTVLSFRFPDYEVGRTIRTRVVNVTTEEIITEKDTDGVSREDLVVKVTFMRDDFAEAYAD